MNKNDIIEKQYLCLISNTTYITQIITSFKQATYIVYITTSFKQLKQKTQHLPVLVVIINTKTD